MIPYFLRRYLIVSALVQYRIGILDMRFGNGLVIIIRPVWVLCYRSWFAHSSIALARLKSSFTYSWDLPRLTLIYSQALLTLSISSECSHANNGRPTKRSEERRVGREGRSGGAGHQIRRT